MNPDKQICWNCDNPIEYINVRTDGTVFCSKCGAKLSEPSCPEINLEDAIKRRFNVIVPEEDPKK
jgi:predicted amidophosphoribosyltransferase